MSTAEQPQPALRDLVLDEVHAEMGRRRMTGAKLARRLGKSQSSVARRLDGRQTMDLDDLEMICSALGVSPAKIMAEAALRAAEGIRSSGIMSVDMAPYSRASSRRCPPLRLVKGTGADYGVVADGYGSSDEDAGEDDDDPEDPNRDSGVTEGLFAASSAVGVNSADAA